MEQIALLPSSPAPWTKQVLTSCRGTSKHDNANSAERVRFAYCSTVAVWVWEAVCGRRDKSNKDSLQEGEVAAGEASEVPPPVPPKPGFESENQPENETEVDQKLVPHPPTTLPSSPTKTLSATMHKIGGVTTQRGGALRKFWGMVAGTSTDDDTPSAFPSRISEIRLLRVLTIPKRDEGAEVVCGVCWNPLDIDTLAVSFWDGALRIYDLVTGSVRETYDTKQGLKWMGWDAGRVWGCGEGKWYKETTPSGVDEFTLDMDVRGVERNPVKPDLLAVTDSKHLYIVALTSRKPAKFRIPLSEYKGSKMTVVRWDPKSGIYLLVGFDDGRIVLVDTDQKSIVMNFAATNGGVGNIEWMPTVPGGFLTTDTVTGVVRVWNVARSTSETIYRLLPSAIHCLTPISVANESLFLMAFGDGSVGIYDVGRGEWVYLRQGGHTETIFGCAFGGTGGTLLATGSFDGTLKIWDTGSGSVSVSQSPARRGSLSSISTSQTGIQSLSPRPIEESYPNHTHYGPTHLPISLLDSYPPTDTGRVINHRMHTVDGCIYSVAFSPCGSRVAMGTGIGMVVVWDVEKSRVLGRWRVGECPVYCVKWGNGIAAAKGDGVCTIIHPDTGESISSFTHPSGNFGCDFDPFHACLATSCMDGKVRIWSLANTNISTSSPPTTPTTPTATTSTTPTSASPLVLTGHTARTFTVLYSPTLPHILASASDDTDVRIWHTKHAQCMTVLKGHRDKVRGLAWCTELPAVLVSGGWDSVIRIWDIRTSQTLHIVTHHQADVYGLSTHPSRPFLFASSSRDNTLRLWSMEELVRDVIWSVLKWIHEGGDREALNKILLVDKENALEKTTGFKLCGEGSTKLVEHLCGDIPPVEKWASVFEFFSPTTGTKELWSLLRTLHSPTPHTHPTPYSTNTILHHSDTLHSAELRAHQLELSTRASPHGLARLLTSYKKQRLEQAATEYLLLGKFKKYCEAMMVVGRWERAMAVAPCVGMGYWREVCMRYAEVLRAKGDQDVVTYLLAAGCIDELIPHLLHTHNTPTAALVAKVYEDGGYTHLPSASSASPPTSPTTHSHSNLTHSHPNLSKSHSNLPPLPDHIQDRNFKQSKDEILKQSENEESWVQRVAKVSVKRYMAHHQPDLAAASYIAVDDPKAAIDLLILHNHHTTAYALSSLYAFHPQITRILQKIQ
ncbi:WD40-repeat-containing domain protein [Gaertneriomyces semiglobifer]|nr:WD40-repeat-containing domain protein [Gaertneriomyces semiglobifer]